MNFKCKIPNNFNEWKFKNIKDKLKIHWHDYFLCTYLKFKFQRNLQIFKLFFG